MSDGQRLVDGEFVFRADDFRRIAAILHESAGIALSESKATLVYSRLAKRLRTLGLESFRDYCALVADANNVDERQKMIAALTTNVTRFFREPHHFDHLKTRVLPPLLNAARSGGSVRIWSAGCSSGEEPYSIALTILSLMPEAADLDVRILATDIDTNMIAHGRAGVYGASNMLQIPGDLRSRWFDKDGERWQAGEALRKLIVFNELNLMGDWPMKRRYDAIFCRNVVIYFEEPTQARVFSRFLPLMAPHARLYIGHSERICGPAAASLETDGVTIYRLKEPAR
ncbi:protein-glutamate O-methyltransferase CheR [Phenylobacterium sp. J426]|uniref:CheR family methyltransferase n=1 Tax=Phenylobacterium sp. J426 TaxID=2898439 RepID=UPI0021507569|nr:protein-glutamate O-methyltransferase CheR [Phenylobacterium sp. J426]MCR5873854.1 protein-glutamate O-methyltransferase CheR [Phenylobacterium sp. J426]